MISLRSVQRLAPPLKVALAVGVLVAAYATVVMIRGMSVTTVLGFLVLLVLMSCIAVGVLVELAYKAILNRSCPWAHIGAFSIIVAMLGLLTLGHGVTRLLILRTQLIVAATGGHDALQAWAVDILAKPRDLMQEDGGYWIVPKQYYSKQVTRLHPIRVYIAPAFEGGKEGVCLVYPMPHAGVEIRVGPPGAAPLEDKDSLEAWLRCGDGLYFWDSG
jgi:hypothetical protein